MLTGLLSVLRLVAALFESAVGAALPQYGAALVLVAVLSAVLVIVVRSVAAPSPQQLAVGDRARAHAVQLQSLPNFSHPDARGHARPRAPGILLPVA